MLIQKWQLRKYSNGDSNGIFHQVFIYEFNNRSDQYNFTVEDSNHTTFHREMSRDKARDVTNAYLMNGYQFSTSQARHTF